MNVSVSRTCSFLFSVAVLVFTVLSCKKQIPDDEQLLANCKLAEFTQFGISYAFEYDSRNRPTSMSRVRGGGAGYDPLFFEYSDERLSTILIEVKGNKYPKTKFEYQNNKLSSIQNFDVARKDFTSTAVNVTLTESVDFQYTSGNKPTGLTRWLPDEKGQLYKSHESVLEYNSNGNLVKETMHLFTQQTALEADYLYEYFYDEKPNTRRPLHMYFFYGMESVPLLFSTNNMNRLKITYNGQTIRDQTLDLAYDPDGNVTSDTYQYADIKWICR